ncbi:MAG: ABC transporter ATP-binding protein, partial [Solobacterium sp.]|nr:ABC transporter ATP-binding protein [Solobacterium sp.]
DSIIAFADIGDFINQPVKTYSSGMFVRLAFAVAINIDPEILIVDEALSVGDVYFQSKCYKKFDEFKQAGRTVLLVSHDLSSIAKYCDRVILMRSGKKLAEGKPQAMIDLYKKVLVNQVDEEGNDIQTASGVREDTSELSKEMRRNPEFSEYGTKEAEIVDFGILDENGVPSQDIIKGRSFTIRIRVRFHRDVNFPILAFTIKNIKGQDVTGTNTWYEHADIAGKAGEERKVSFTQQMDLQGGQYLLSLGCTGYEGDEFVVYHRLYDVCDLTVVSDKNTVGFYDMNSVVTVEQ